MSMRSEGLHIINMVERYAKRRGQNEDMCIELMSFIMLSGCMKEELFWNCFAPILDTLISEGAAKEWNQDRQG